MSHATLTPEVEAVLRASTITGNTLTLPPGQLDRKLYEAVNKVIVNCGGKWDRFKKGHVFPSDPSAKLGLGGTVLATGVAEDTKKTLQAFYTPAAVATRAVELAEVEGAHVMEPSCGGGALVAECLAQGAAFVEGHDINPEAIDACKVRFKAHLTVHDDGTVVPGLKQQVDLVHGDFLKDEPEPLFDRIVMNPPFAKGQDIKHVVHALRYLASHGVLVAIMSPMAPDKPAFKKATVGYVVTTEEVPAGSFKESGTNIRTVIVKIIAA